MARVIFAQRPAPLLDIDAASPVRKKELVKDESRIGSENSGWVERSRDQFCFLFAGD